MVKQVRWIYLPLCLGLVFQLSGYTASVQTAHGQSTAPAIHPSLRSATSTDSSPRVEGKGWVPLSRVSVSVRYFTLASTRTLQTTASGTFGLELQGGDWCRGLVVVARDTFGHRVTLRGPLPLSGCTPPESGARLVLRVLTPQQMEARQITVDTTKGLNGQTMHVGDVLYLYVSGTAQPSETAVFDPSHFRLIEQGQVPVCPPATSCRFPPGFFWRAVATAAGNGFVALSAACRQSKPACMVPDRVLQVTILP